jgi:hypothetical protein
MKRVVSTTLIVIFSSTIASMGSKNSSDSGASNAESGVQSGWFHRNLLPWRHSRVMVMVQHSRQCLTMKCPKAVALRLMRTELHSILEWRAAMLEMSNSTLRTAR